MADGEFALGFAVVAGGLWLIDSAVQNRSPIATLKQIISDPKNFRSTLANSKGTGFLASTPLVVGSSSVTGPAVSSGSAGIPGAVSGGNAQGSVAGMSALAFAQSQIGKPYVWGATGPNAYDCSGLVYRSFLMAGVRLGRTTYQQVLEGSPVAKGDLAPGDLVFPDPGHVQIYAGNGLIVEAPHTGLAVREVAMWGFWKARRIG